MRALLAAHTPSDAQEARCVERTLAALDAPGDLFSKRSFEPGHVCSSALVVSPDERSILLVSHRDFGFWMQPGGHLDPEDPDTLAAARRELAEEAGLTDVDRPEWATGLLDVDVHDVPAGMKRGEPAHNHFDIRYAFRARTLEVTAATDAKDAKWFPFDGLDEVNTDDSVRRAARRLTERIAE
ncbi:MAG: NUDIX domain-containing protein [Proteobacteria bacterium]|nr:NUDIX domain-containing protein [Pseudomonadota bacterium]